MTAASQIPLAPDVPQRIADRYRITSELGRGGMAVAYLVHDEREDRPLALKRLLSAEGGPNPKLVQFFEHEYRALKHLHHPRVVQVHGFGWDEESLPYYTMEWLGGGDLQGLAPLPVERVCALLSDVSSALSLLHSRGFVHRDVTPRNIRCTEDGLAKLIDFGAVAPFGASAQVVGTPAFCPPEALRGMQLDGRTDLFALGGAAYFALTGRHPYPARTFSGLDALWQHPIHPPSRLVSGVPPELDTLILELLALDRDARPRTAVEVMERFGAIGHVELREELVVQQAYVSMPRLQGRETALGDVRGMLQRSARRRARVVQVVGSAASGRSRFLAQCALEAQLQGMAVARADASDATSDYGVARALIDQLLDGRDAPSPTPAEPTDPANSLRPALSSGDLDAQTLADALIGASALRPLMLVVDDVHLIDERSAALLSLLAASEGGGRLVLVVSQPTDIPADATQRSLHVLYERSSLVELAPLSASETRALLASIFGEVPHLDVLADRLYRTTEGMPGAIMQAAQHLLDRGIIQFDRGLFVLPAELQADDLPGSVIDAVRMRLASLSTPAQRMAHGLALVERDGLTTEELRILIADVTDDEADEAVDELLGQHFLNLRDGKHQLANETYRRAFVDALSHDDVQALHRQLAAIYSLRKERTWAMIQHLILSGDHATALARLLPTARDHSLLTPDQVAAEICHLPRQWQSYMRELLDYCERSGRPKVEQHHIRNTLVSYAALTAEATKADLIAVKQQLEHDCGVDLYRAQPDTTPDSERLMVALQGAQTRFDGTPENERVYPPGEALPWLAKTVVVAIGVMGARYDYRFFRDLTCIEPFVSLSPALQIVQWNVEATRAIAEGRYDVVLERTAAMIERMGEPDRAGLDPLVHRFMGLALRYSYGLNSMPFGLALNEEYMAALDADPLFAINGRLIRMLDALCHGDTRRADELKREAELIRLRDNPPQMFAGATVHREYWVYAFAGDLARLKQILPQLEARGAEMPDWLPIARHAQASYHRLRGAHGEALAILQATLEGVNAGESPAWTALAADEVQSLTSLGRHDEAVSTGEQHLQEARRVALGPSMYPLLEALALAHVHEGQTERAVELGDEVVGVLEDLRAGGLVLGGAYETRARIALAAGDHTSFDHFAARCGEIYQAGKNPLLVARYTRLVQSRAQHGTRQVEADHVVPVSEVMTSLNAQLLSDFADGPERARVVLTTLLSEAHTDSGFLYLIQDGQPHLSAQVGPLSPPLNLDQLIEMLVGALDEDADGLTQTGTMAIEPDGPGGGGATGWANAEDQIFSPVLLSHESETGREITGVIVLGPGGKSPPLELLAGASQALQRAGDVTPLHW